MERASSSSRAASSWSRWACTARSSASRACTCNSRLRLSASRDASKGDEQVVDHDRQDVEQHADREEEHEELAVLAKRVVEPGETVQRHRPSEPRGQPEAGGDRGRESMGDGELEEARLLGRHRPAGIERRQAHEGVEEAQRNGERQRLRPRQPPRDRQHRPEQRTAGKPRSQVEPQTAGVGEKRMHGGVAAVSGGLGVARADLRASCASASGRAGSSPRSSSLHRAGSGLRVSGGSVGSAGTAAGFVRNQ